MVILGLTGSIGMGKSTAAKAFRRLGAAVYSADAEVHRLLDTGGEGVGAIAAAFPEAVRRGTGDRSIDRVALGAIVFKDRRALVRLEAILHPMVRARERRFLVASELAGRRLAVLDIPLLFETGGESRCDATAVVSAPYFIQRRRVLGRSGMNEAKLAGILARQMPDLEKRRRADFVIATGLGRRESMHTVRVVARRLRCFSGRCWPRCWPPASTRPT
jgi:dephospho-CoA kinase